MATLIGPILKKDALFDRSNTGGPYTLAGTITVGGSPAHRPVRLYDLDSGLLVREMWSAADGSYAFAGLNDSVHFVVTATDYPGFNYRDAVAAKPAGIWRIDLNLDNSPQAFSIETGASDYGGYPPPRDGLLRSRLTRDNPIYGGSATLQGRIKLNDISVRRRVYLYAAKSGVLLESIYSDAAGNFAFAGINGADHYTVLVSDRPFFTNAPGIASQVTPQGVTPVYWDTSGPGLPLTFYAVCLAAGENWVGTKAIAGKVKIGAMPARRRVRLYEHRTGRLLRETWCATDGSYRFDGLNPDYRFTVTATDYPSYAYNDTIAANLTPE